MSPLLRQATVDDLPAIRQVCIRTGAAGQDATGTYPDDGILPDLFAEPYVRLEPQHAFVAVDDADAVLGYVVGAADTDGFVAAWRRHWLPVAAARHPAPVAEPTSAYERLVALLHRPEDLRPQWADRYPAHLHVDLLPEAQGRGFGRALVERFCEVAASSGAAGVHLGVAADNRPAQGFYPRVGFEVLGRGAGVVWFGRPL